MKTVSVILVLLAAASSSFSAPYDESLEDWVFAKPDWKEKDFQDRFLGRYGVNGYTEPQLDVENFNIYQGAMALVDDKEKMIAYLKNGIAQLEAEGIEASASLHFVLASVSYETGDEEKAIEEYITAIRKHPSFLRAYANLGFALMDKDEPEKALPVLLKAVELGANESQIHGLIGHIYLGKELYDSALTAFRQAMVLSPENNAWRNGALQCLIKMKRYEEALPVADEALAFDRLTPSLWINRANLLLRIGRIDEAIVDLQAGISLGGSSNKTYLNLGRLLFNKQLFEYATEAFEAATKLAENEEGFDSLLESAQFLSNANEIERAAKLLAAIQSRAKELAIEIDPLATGKIEIAIAIAQQDYATALEKLDPIIEQDPGNGYLQLYKARALNATGNIEDAVIAYQIAATLEETAYNAFYEQARIELARGELKSAINLLRKAYAVEPSDSLLTNIREIETYVNH